MKAKEKREMTMWIHRACVSRVALLMGAWLVWAAVALPARDALAQTTTDSKSDDKPAPKEGLKEDVKGEKADKKTILKNQEKLDVKKIEVRKAAKKKEKLKEGWFPKLSLGANTSLTHSSNLPGIDDGLAMNIGVSIDGALLFRKGRHEWKSTLRFVHTQTKTPVYDPFVKTADMLDVQTYYFLRLNDEYEVGIHLGLQFNATLFPGGLVLNVDKNTTVESFDGTTTNPGSPLERGKFFPLTGAFSPVFFKQRLGVAGKPYKDKYASLGLQFDAVVQEVWASGLAVNDNTDTPALELRSLGDFVQAGLQLDISVEGKVNKQISYNFSAELMYPLLTSVPTKGKTGFELLNADISLKVSFKMAKWASIDYTFAAKLTPLLANRWQVSNNLVLSLKADIF